MEQWLADNALVIVGFVATGGAALWRIAALEKRADRRDAEAREDRRQLHQKIEQQRAEVCRVARGTARTRRDSGRVTMAIKILPSQGATLLGTVVNLHDSSSNTPAATRLTTGTLATGDQFQVNRGDRVFVINGATAVNVTIQTTRTVDGLAVADRVVAVAANTTRDILIDGNAYGDTVLFALDSVANVQIGVLR